MSIYRPRFINEWRDIKREGGYKLLLKKKGWQVIVAFFLFYLIRDSILYIIIPYLGYTSLKGLFLSAFLFCGASPASPIQFNSLTSDVRGCQIRTAMD